eukprot:1161929-Pelagomonas_calceolata.AAC.1
MKNSRLSQVFLCPLREHAAHKQQQERHCAAHKHTKKGTKPLQRSQASSLVHMRGSPIIGRRDNARSQRLQASCVLRSQAASRHTHMLVCTSLSSTSFPDDVRVCKALTATITHQLDD